MKAPTVKQGKSAGFDKYLFQLDGIKPPEIFILWCRIINDKVVGSSKPDWDLVFDSLIDLTHDQANTVISLAADDFNNLKLTYGEYGPFSNLATQKKILEISTEADRSIMNTMDGQAVWNTLIGKPSDINPLIFKEIMFRLQELIFGTNMVGRNAYYLLRQLMHSYNVDSHRGIKEWQCCMNQLNGYTKYMPSDSLEKQNEVKEEFTEIKLQELLDMAIPKSYRKKLEGNDCNIYEEPFKRSVDKLITYEPDIKEKEAKAKKQ